MVKKSTIQKRKNDRWVCPPELARYDREMTIDEIPDERGMYRVHFDEPTEPKPEGLDPCWEYCKKYTKHIKVACNFKLCWTFYCTECRKFSGGMGPVGCPCDTGWRISGYHGHHTRDEQPKWPVGQYKKRGRGPRHPVPDNLPVKRRVENDDI